MAALAAAGAGSDASSHSGSGSEPESEEEDEEPARPPCFHCGIPSWRTLSRSIGALAVAPGAGAILMREGLGGNEFERGVLEEWLGPRGGLVTALNRALEEPNPPGVARVHVVLERAAAPGSATALAAAAAPPAPADGGSSGSSSGAAPPPAGAAAAGAARPAGVVLPDGALTELNACKPCATGLLRAIVYALRERIPDAELPARARGRPDCWYGRGCRTMRHKPMHAAKLNHICEQRRFG